MLLHKLAQKIAEKTLYKNNDLKTLSTKLKEESLLEQRTKTLITLYISFCVLIFAIVFFLIRIFYFEDFSILSYTLSFLILYFIGLIIFIVKSHRIDIAIFLINLALFIFIPVRTFQTGGVYSAMVLGYVAHTTMAFALVGQRFGAFTLSWSILNFAFFSYYGTFYDFTPNIFFETSIGAGVSVALMFLVTCLPILFIINERKILFDKLRHFDKQQTANTIMHRLAHETGNSLHIALGHLDILKDQDGKSLKHIKRIQSRLEEMDEIVKTMTSISYEEDLSSFLLELEEDTQIIHALRKKELKRKRPDG